MRSANGLVLAAVLTAGVLLGIHARGGVELASEGAVPARGEGVRDVNRAGRWPVVEARPVSVQVVGGQVCQQDGDCLDGWICLRDDPFQTGSCRQTCEDAGSCDHDGLTCTEPACVRQFRDTGQPVFVCESLYSRAQCGHLRATHLVTMVLPTFRDNARSLGVWGECVDEDLGPTVPTEECVFTVEAVQYRRRDLTGATKFEAVCIDLDTRDNTPTCSPMERDPIEIGVGLSIGAHVGGEGGVAAGLGAAGNVEVDGSLGIDVPIVVHRKLRYPTVRPRFGGRMGGNILIESGIGSLVAKQSAIFTHDGFDGVVTFFVTKPEGMRLTSGYKSPIADPVCVPGPCPADFANVLSAAGGLGGPGAALAGSAAAAGRGDPASDFDIQELIDALDDETQTINEITDELKMRIEQKITEVFDTLRSYLEPRGSSAAAGQRSVLVEQMMSLLRERIRENLEEIREIVRELVRCPE